MNRGDREFWGQSYPGASGNLGNAKRAVACRLLVVDVVVMEILPTDPLFGFILMVTFYRTADQQPYRRGPVYMPDDTAMMANPEERPHGKTG
jgi:hypothetical protein